MRTFFVLLLILLSAGRSSVYAESPEKESERIQMAVEFVSRYVWRGYQLGGPGFQASVNGELFGNDSHALELEAWGYSDLDVSTKEIDFTLSYSFLQRKAAIRLHNYWYVPETAQNYFDYKNNSTSHTFELQFDYTCDLKHDNSLTFMWASMVYGNDKKPSSAGNFKQAYSSSFEIKYEGNFLSPKYGCEASIGFSPWESPMNYEVEKFSWINAELKVNRSFSLSDDVALTPSVALTVNPAYKDVYVSLGVAVLF